MRPPEFESGMDCWVIDVHVGEWKGRDNAVTTD